MVFQFETGLSGGFGKGIPTFKGEAQAEFLDGGIGEAPVSEVFQSYSGQVALEEFEGEVVDDK